MAEQEHVEEPPSSSSTTASSNNIAKRAAWGTVATLLLRLVSFACTQWTFRRTDPDTLGRTAIQLELLHSTCIFTSREGFRLSLTRDDFSASSNNWNVAWLTIPVSTIVSSVALGWHLLRLSSSDENSDEDYRWGGILYCLAACLEGWAEPAVLWSLRQVNVAVKASAEGVATVGKTVAIVFLLQQQNGIMGPVTAFGTAQVVYSILYGVTLYGTVYRELIGPRWRRQLTKGDDNDKSSSASLLDPRTCYMTAIFTLQGFFKHVLTEGDKIVLSTISSSYDQGVYAMGSAYGSLAARVILQPIEENSRLLWSRQAASSSSRAASSAKTIDPLELSYTVLVKLVLYIGFVFCFLAPNYTSILLAILAGRKWGDNEEAAAVLSAFCVYTAFLAWNGTTEAFVYATASTATDLGQLGAAHTGTGLVFAVTAPLAVARYGTTGLVAANCFAMLCRALYAVHFAADYFCNRRPSSSNSTEVISKATKWTKMGSLIRRMFPHWIVVCAFVACFAGTNRSLVRFQLQTDGLEPASADWFRQVGEHVAVGVSLAIGLLTVAYAVERDFMATTRKLWRGHLD